MAQDESPTIQVEETQYDANKEPYVQASQPDPKNKESPPTAQKPKTPGQLMTPATPRTRAESAQTPPLGPAPSLPSQYPVPQSPSQESDDGSSENSDDGPKEAHREKEKVDPHVLPQFDWEGLETEYYAALSRANDVEANLNEEFKALANFFAQWSNMSLAKDEERAVKRFRTRQEHVFHSEDKFSKKKEHHEEVVKALKSVMALMHHTN
ncbi:hypothetical protein VE01_09200 [Pseudogymnoascus verrucosus]|uniref:Uncharacterized protein n=1 Tax=Pseudogymnoascus verrucosus TaxID=342668 RepID=A0A1B8GBC1_9PEZI|nr:uncharacterized protein VE01_09200 [Pseudogymnoascus verrucosus]OBT93120.1 hypothetical protein VE01_09200 [Pseudogymnoascus verrucosus]